MSQGRICILKPGHTMPEAYKDKFLADAVSFSFGAVVDGAMQTATINSNEFVLKDSLTDIEKKYKDRLLVVRSELDDLAPEEEQPMPLIIDDKGNMVAVAFTEGDFAKYATEDAENSPEAEFIIKYFGDKVNTLYSQCSGDYKKLSTLLDVASFRSELQEHLEPRGVVVLLGQDGNTIMYARSNDKFGEFNWGQVSQTLGYLEAKGTGPQPDIEKKETYQERMARLKAQKAGDQPITTTPAAAPPAEPKTVEVPPKVDGQPALNPDTGTIMLVDNKRMVFPPKRLQGSELRKFYSKHSKKGHKAYDWGKRPGIDAEDIPIHSHFFNYLFPASKAPEAKEKNVVPTHIQPGESGIVEGTLDVLSPKQVELSARLYAEDKNVMSVEQIMAHVEKIPGFSQRLPNVSFEDLLFKRFEWYENLGKMDYKSLACLTQELRCWIINNHQEMFKNYQAKKAAETKAASEPGKTLSYQERMALLKAKKSAA